MKLFLPCFALHVWNVPADLCARVCDFPFPVCPLLLLGLISASRYQKEVAVALCVAFNRKHKTNHHSLSFKFLAQELKRGGFREKGTDSATNS